MKTIVRLLFLFVPFLAQSQAPVNDDCIGIINVGEVPFCSQPGQYTNLNATASNIDPISNIPDCFNNGTERDVWFQFSLPADGSITDISIDVFGNLDGNGTLRMPQVALYRGDVCAFGELAELSCAAAPINVNQVHLEQFGLSAGTTYYLRINDYSASAAPNWGTFKLCIVKYVPDIIIGTTPGTGACTGTLFDSGGETGDYMDNENLSISICPADFHQCIKFNIENYSIEGGSDYLRFYQGDNVASGTEITAITGTGDNFEVQISGACATVQFTSDFFINDSGFKITWSCTPDVCTTPPPTTCDAPIIIPTMPFQAENLNNCFSGNTIEDGPCDDEFLEGNDYVFSYTSLGDECIRVAVSGASTGSGIGVYDQCPSLAGANCIASVGGGFGQFDPVINAAFLENPGTYYLVFGSGPDCSTFNISVDTVTCPIILPSAALCENALNIGGCSNILPQIIALNPGAGDPDFIQDGVNQGCFVNPMQNYSFFYFTAGSNGKFGFEVQAANPDEASDIDINVWGPINNVADICNFVSNNQPVRSTWAAGPDLTGLADVHPETGIMVTDAFDCGSTGTPSADGDDFVSALPVQQGKIYVVLMDDFGQSIQQGGISIDFSGTTSGVLDGADAQITVTGDTAICPGQSVQLNAGGGEVYFWKPDNGTLSCINCQNTIATPTESATYQVDIVTACNIISKLVDVLVYDVTLGPDVTVCNNASFELNPHPFASVNYAWIGPNLTCNNCPTPTVQGLTTGTYQYIATMTTPNCVLKDTVIVNVIGGQQPLYNIQPDTIICVGETVNLGGGAFTETGYTWSSLPSGFASNISNPAVSPTQTTMYYLVAQNASCALPALDSILVTVFQIPDLHVNVDTVICQGQSVVLGLSNPIAGDQYQWIPNNGTIDDPNSANPLATPTSTTLYEVRAFNLGCEFTSSVAVEVTPIEISLDQPDTVRICQGTALPISVSAIPANTPIVWSPSFGLSVTNNGLNAVASPIETILYAATISVPGCTKTDRIYIKVDSLPDNMQILPQDTSICMGTKVLLKSKTYDPAEYPEIVFTWYGEGQLTPDSLYNMVAQPEDTLTYLRIATSGACMDTQRTTVNVKPIPMMSVTPSSSAVCPGGTVALTLTATPGTEKIEWSPAETLTCSDCNNPVASPLATTTYNVKGELNGCPANASATVEVREKPRYKFPDDKKLCGGESITLNEINDPTATYTWTSNDPNFGTNTSAQPSITPTQTFTYNMTATNGCEVADQLTIEVSNANLSAKGDTTICRNSTALLTANGTLPGTYTWSPGNNNGQEILVSPSATTVYTVTYLYGDNCTKTDQVTVNVQGEAPVLSFPNDTQLCPGQSTALNNSTNPNATYSWTSTPAGFVSSAESPLVAPETTTTYNVTATIGICSVSGQVTITAHRATLTASADLTLCEGEIATLNANGSAPGTYQWTPGGSQQTIDVSPPVTTNYQLLYVYGDNCTLTESVNVTVVEGIQALLVCQPDTNTISVGDPLTLSVNVLPSQTLTGFKYAWEENGTNVGNASTLVVETSRDSENGSDIVLNYVLNVESQFGCKAQDTKTITIKFPKVEIPNAFTPDGDGTNDTFGLIVKEGSVTIQEMSVYSRWGQKVFSSTSLTDKWDGTDGDGKVLPSDVYIYKIKWARADGVVQPVLSGDVTLIR